MKSLSMHILCLLAGVVAGCGAESPTPIETNEPLYVTLDDDLTQFKADFNAMTDKVRLVFISGPSCGICLRGLDDLDRAIVASVQDDPRIHTMVLHVPTLGAEEKHAAASVPLMYGPRISHYWDPSGHSGQEFQKALDIPFYAWDVWMIYQPGDGWVAGQAPPAPDYWEHQLGPLPKETTLDAQRFAGKVRERLAALPPATEESRMAAFRQLDKKMLEVAQPRGVMIQNNHESRGGYENLKTISAIRYEGRVTINDQSYPLVVETGRPHSYKRTITSGSDRSSVSYDGARVSRDGPPLGLAAAVQDELLASYQFDGLMTDFKAKGHQVLRLGMKTHAGRLPWIMEAELANGRTWHIYVDSHTGDIYRQALINADDKETLAVEFDAFEDVDDFRLPHEIRYFDGHRLLAIDRFERINVTLSIDDARANVLNEILR